MLELDGLQLAGIAGVHQRVSNRARFQASLARARRPGGSPPGLDTACRLPCLSPRLLPGLLGFSWASPGLPGGFLGSILSSLEASRARFWASQARFWASEPASGLPRLDSGLPGPLYGFLGSILGFLARFMARFWASWPALWSDSRFPGPILGFLARFLVSWACSCEPAATREGSQPR